MLLTVLLITIFHPTFAVCMMSPVYRRGTEDLELVPKLINAGTMTKPFSAVDATSQKWERTLFFYMAKYDFFFSLFSGEC